MRTAKDRRPVVSAAEFMSANYQINPADIPISVWKRMITEELGKLQSLAEHLPYVLTSDSTPLKKETLWGMAFFLSHSKSRSELTTEDDLSNKRVIPICPVGRREQGCAPSADKWVNGKANEDYLLIEPPDKWVRFRRTFIRVGPAEAWTVSISNHSFTRVGSEIATILDDMGNCRQVLDGFARILKYAVENKRWELNKLNERHEELLARLEKIAKP